MLTSHVVVVVVFLPAPVFVASCTLISRTLLAQPSYIMPFSMDTGMYVFVGASRGGRDTNIKGMLFFELLFLSFPVISVSEKRTPSPLKHLCPLF